MPLVTTPPPSLADRIEDLLPQTQCTKCGFAGCRPYAEAIAEHTASYDQCPPGGAEGIARLAALLGKPVIPLNVEHGVERPRPVAVIEEALCIGCTLCIQACPVDAIVGAAKRMHTVVESLCTGCDLCVAPCPVDCITMVPVTGDATGWDAWSQTLADDARARHEKHLQREQRAREAAERRIAQRQAAHRAHDADVPAADGSPGASPAAGGQPASVAGAIKPEHASDAARSASATSTDTIPQVSADRCVDSLANANDGDTASQSAPPVPPAALSPDDRKKAIIAAALERARQKKAELTQQGAGPKNTDNVSASVQAQIDEADARRKRLGIDPDKP